MFADILLKVGSYMYAIGKFCFGPLENKKYNKL